MITEDEKLLREFNSILRYNPDTGEFRWKRARQGAPKGGLVGCKTPAGYVHAKILFKQYQLHRVAWFMVHHRWPAMLDHINGDRADNRIVNLREVTSRMNNQNRNSHRNGRLVGACHIKRTGKWRASIREAGKCRFLGEYPTELEAHKAYMAAVEKVSQPTTTSIALG